MTTTSIQDPDRARPYNQLHNPHLPRKGVWWSAINKLTIVCAIFLFTEAWIWPPDLTLAPGKGGEFQYLLKGLTYFLFLVQAGRYFATTIEWNTSSVFFCFQLFWMLLFTALAPVPFYSLQYLASFLGISFGAIVIWRDNGLDAILRTGLNTLIIILVGSILLAIFVPSIGVHSRLDVDGYWRGMFTSKNGLGQASFIAGLLLLAKRRSLHWLELSGKAGVIALCLLLSRSATSTTCLVVALAMYAVFSAIRRVRFGGQFSRVVTVFGGPIMIALVIAFWLDILALLGRDATLGGRLVLWRLALGLWEQAPILGRGLAFFTSDPGTLAYVRAATFVGFVDSHNAYIQTMLDTGLVGLALFLIPFVLLVLIWFIKPSGFREADPDVVVVITIQVFLFSITETANSFYRGFGMMLINLFLISYFQQGRSVRAHE